MKKYMYFALALPLLFACSSDDLLDKEVVSNDQFAGIEKVDATFSMDELGGKTRMDNGSWLPQEGDVWGFAWLTDKYTNLEGDAKVPITGSAFQNHNLIQNSNGYFEPQTSIYVGKYYLYRPYDATTVSPEAIKFNSLVEQPLAEGYKSTTDAWKNVAKTAINIGDKWTDVTPDGRTYGNEKIWDQPGIKKPYKLFGAMFSNQTGLDLTYEKNNPTFTAATAISGATDINHTFEAGTAVGAAEIYKAEVTLTGAANSFTYAPTVEPNNGQYPQRVGDEVVYHNGDFWADKMNLAGVAAGEPCDGFAFTNGAITLNSPDANKDGVLDGISTGDNGSKGWFWFNSLPVTNGEGNLGTVVTPVLETSYGKVTVKKSYDPEADYTVGDCAYAFDKYDASATANEWIKLGGADVEATATTPATWNLPEGNHKTFINQYGNHKGKYALTVDFSKGVMNGMHIVNDGHLQKLLKYYIASGKTEVVSLNLDEDANHEFKISKISIALLQTINATADKVLVHACAEHGTPKIIVTQAGQADLGLADKKEVPALKNVFDAKTDVFLSSDCEWTWSGGEDGTKKLSADGWVKSITNEGTLTVNATNVEVSYSKTTLANAAGATMNITQVTTVKNALSNLGIINVGSTSNTAAELRAYGKAITNDATSLTAYGIINNYGAVGVSEGTGEAAKFNNYGHIIMFGDAITLLTTNELDATPDDEYGPFKAAFNAATNKMGTVELPEGKPTAIVSVSNEAETGFIKYNWDATTYSKATTNVKYNTIVIDNHNIEFTGDAPATEVQFIEFKNTNRALVVNPAGEASKLTALRGVIVNAGSSIIIEKTNEVVCHDGAFLGTGATVYKGGFFSYPVGGTTNYLGNWLADQVVVFGN